MAATISDQEMLNELDRLERGTRELRAILTQAGENQRRLDQAITRLERARTAA